eukprot:1145936-Pelagomonas_calceolata.AAC.2
MHAKFCHISCGEVSCFALGTCVQGQTRDVLGRASNTISTGVRKRWSRMRSRPGETESSTHVK